MNGALGLTLVRQTKSLIEGKSALVTGSTRGIAPGVRCALAATANVMLNGFGDPPGAQRAAMSPRSHLHANRDESAV